MGLLGGISIVPPVIKIIIVISMFPIITTFMIMVIMIQSYGWLSTAVSNSMIIVTIVTKFWSRWWRGMLLDDLANVKSAATVIEKMNLIN